MRWESRKFGQGSKPGGTAETCGLRCEHSGWTAGETDAGRHRAPAAEGARVGEEIVSPTNALEEHAGERRSGLSLVLRGHEGRRA